MRLALTGQFIDRGLRLGHMPVRVLHHQVRCVDEHADRESGIRIDVVRAMYGARLS